MKNILKNTLSILLILFVICCVVMIHLLVGLAILSIIAVPITYFYSLTTGQSYSQVCDSSNIIYNLNRIGKYSFIILLSILIGYLVLKT